MRMRGVQKSCGNNLFKAAAVQKGPGSQMKRDLVEKTVVASQDRRCHVECCIQGLKKGAKGSQFPGRQIATGRRISEGDTEWLQRAQKSPNNVTSTFFNTVRFLPKVLRFEHGGVKQAFRPRSYLTLLRS